MFGRDMQENLIQEIMAEATSNTVELLDHGYVQLVESWGSDERIIEAARMSTNKGFQGWGERVCKNCSTKESEVVLDPTDDIVDNLICFDSFGHSWVQKVGDEKLLRYLYTNKHMTPFEMAGMIIEVQAPIFVFREWQRHRTQSYNELSARYTELPDMCYVPSVARLQAARQSQTNRQGSEQGFSEEDAVKLQQDISYAYSAAQMTYRELLKKGVARELARVVVPVGQYSRMRASANLRNWLQFLELRLPENVQQETREYAQVIEKLVAQLHPRTYELFKEAHGSSGD